MKPRLSPRYAITTYGIALLVVALIAGTALLAARELSRRALVGVEQQAGRFIGGAQSALNRAVLGVDVLLAGAGDLVPQPELLQLPAERARISRLMEIGVNQNPLAQKLMLVSADGSMRVSSEERGRGSEGRAELPAGYLEAVLRQTVPSLVIGDPVTSPSTYQPVLHFGRALRLSDGARVAVVAEVDLAILMNLLVQGADINGLEVTLERENGLLLASVPTYVRSQMRERTPVIGGSVPPGRDAEPVLREARLTGAPAIVVVRRSLQPGVLVTASIPFSFALADWRRERNVIFVFALTLIWAVVAAALLVHRRIQRQWRVRLELLRSRAQLDQALESMQVGFVLLDADDRMLVWNHSFLEIFPWAQSLTGPQRPFGPILERSAQYRRHAGDIAGKVDPAAWLAQERAAGLSSQFESELALPDGRVIRSTKNRTPDGGLVCIYQDVTEKKQYTAELVERRAQLQATLDALPDTLLELDGNGMCHQFHAPQGVGGPIAIDDPVGRAVHDFLPAAAAGAVMEAVREADKAGASRGRYFELAVPEGAGHFEISVSRKTLHGIEPPGYIVILRDVTQAELASRHIRQLAFYDVLTGLPNRRYLLDLMASAVRIDPDSGQHGAVLFLDLDDFKTLNDALGHAMGDVLLKEAAVRISRHIRPGDVVARLGGDEFVVMLERLGPDHATAQAQARDVGERVLAALNVPFPLDPQTTYQRTCSIGVALFDGRERSLEELLKQADIAMYVAKTAGGNGVRFFEPAMQASVAARSALENEIREALSARQFVLYYQSQVDASGAVIGAEALVRWRHPQRGLVLPGDFIGVAESTELIVPLGLQVLEMACAQLALWQGQPDRAALQLAVNVSARQFRRDDFVEQVERVLAASGADPAMLKLELTESLLQSQMEETIRTMHRLKALGIRFSMDDFGTGYSSLSYLTQLPLDQIKIDKYFVGGIGRDPKIELIVQTIIGMAGNLDVELIAEGVETQEQRRFLQQNGCFRYQGYLFSRPVPIADFERALGRPAA